jgi:hypothetical protein
MFFKGIKVFLLYTVSLLLSINESSTKVGFKNYTLNFLLCADKKISDLLMEDQMSQGSTCQDIRHVNLHKASTTESQV